MNTFQVIVFWLFIGSGIYTAISFFSKKGAYTQFRSSFSIGLVVMSLLGIASAIMGIGSDWKLVGREQAFVKQMTKSQGFQFKYLTLRDQRIPLIDGTDAEASKLLESWNVTLLPGVSAKNENDTLYCYTFQKIMFGKDMGDKKVVVHTAPVPAYEFSLFYNQEQQVDTEVRATTDTIATDTVACVEERFKGAGPWSR